MEGRETDVNTKSKQLLVYMFAAAVTVSGCYTQLMTPQEFVQSQRRQKTISVPDNSYSLNYNQSCTTCHSVAELDERAEDLQYYGVRSVHNGYQLSSRQWDEGPVAGEPILIANPNPYWPNPFTPGNAWWVPPGSTTTMDNPSGNRPRTDGPTRDGNRERDRPQTTTSTTYSQPQTPAGGSQPSVPTTPTIVTQQPSSPPPASTNDSGQNRQSGSTPSGRTRTDGSSRDGNERPR